MQTQERNTEYAFLRNMFERNRLVPELVTLWDTIRVMVSIFDIAKCLPLSLKVGFKFHLWLLLGYC